MIKVGLLGTGWIFQLWPPTNCSHYPLDFTAFLFETLHHEPLTHGFVDFLVHKHDLEML